MKAYGALHDRGASALHYIGMVVLAAFIVGGIVAVAAPESFKDSFTRAVCVIFGGEGCRKDAGSESGWRPLTPLEKATQGTVWFGGDSFASGEGIGKYASDTNKDDWNFPWQEDKNNKCHRSPSSYQAQVFSELQGMGYFDGQQYKSNACSGAVTSDLHQDNGKNYGEGPQGQHASTDADNATYDKIPDDASLIQLSMGGNDLGFAEVLRNCVWGELGSGCMDTGLIEQRAQDVYGTATSTGALEDQIRKIKAKRPGARVVIMGYPPLFAEKRSHWGISVDEQRWINEMSSLINDRIKQMAERVGAEFIDPTSAFVGTGYDHRIGSDDEWINGVTTSSEACHPNQKGHDAMAALMLKHIKEGP